jgi:hypothetical protein
MEESFSSSRYKINSDIGSKYMHIGLVLLYLSYSMNIILNMDTIVLNNGTIVWILSLIS